MSIDVEARTIEYTEELLRMWFDKPDNTVLNWIARKIAELEAQVEVLKEQVSETADPEAESMIEEQIRYQLNRLDEQKKCTEEIREHNPSGRGC